MTVEEMFESIVVQERFCFDRIPEQDRRHARADLCAMLYLAEKMPGTADMILGAEHDVVYLAWGEGCKLTMDDVIYLSRCGVYYDERYDGGTLALPV